MVIYEFHHAIFLSLVCLITEGYLEFIDLIINLINLISRRMVVSNGQLKFSSSNGVMVYVINNF